MTAKQAKDTILIVDDTPANLDLLSNILRSAGYGVRPAPNGRLALRAAQNKPPDVILLDINMPEMNGFEVCRRLKEDVRLASIPVLFISALTDTSDKVAAFRAGGVDYITKPFQAAEVLARVNTHLQIKRYQTALMEKSETLQQTIDDLKIAQERLVHSEKMAALGVLTAGIAHEINNPINFIKTSTYALNQDMADLHRLLDAFDQCEPACCDPAATERIATVRAQIDYDELCRELPSLITNITLGVERTEAIVNSLSTYSRPDNEQKTPARIAELIDTTLVLLENRTKKAVTIQKKYGHLPLVPVQSGRLMQVFTNVITNALDAVSDPGQTAPPLITIETATQTRDGVACAVVRVADNGPGISAAIADKIFDPFFTTKEVGQGIGLGLSISYGIIRDHRGTIDVSDQPDHGATISIYLPIQGETS